ncbi:MAG: type II secretion system protein [Candidatus Omnitrophica bacterium]|nr:type II secretion system protein [Candidatus Omnitrophota bacterium]
MTDLKINTKSAGRAGEKGFTLVETMFVGLITVIILSAIVVTWGGAFKNVMNERERTKLRIDLMNAMETIKSDLRLSSLTQGEILFHPQVEGTYTSVSMIIPTPDASTGLLGIDASTNKIEWSKTVIYHIFKDGNGIKSLRRTVINGVQSTEDARRAELTSVIESGTAGGSGYTKTDLVKNLDTFEIEPLTAVVDFYTNSSELVQAKDVIFGWAKIADGSHTIKLENVSHNPSSSGDSVIVDTFMIEPSGGEREAEFFTPEVSGGSVTKVYDDKYNNHEYMNFQAAGTGSYFTITDKYDLLRESSFKNVSLNNTVVSDYPSRTTLAVPTDDQAGSYTWTAESSTGGNSQDTELLGSAASGSGVIPPVVIRTVVDPGNIVFSRGLVRVSFRSATGSPITVDNVYITKGSGAGPLGLTNLDPSGVASPVWGDYHRHQQLFFKDAGGTYTSGVTIPADSEVWSVWTAMPIDEASGYFITVYVSDTSSLNCSASIKADSVDRTFYLSSSLWTSCTADPDTDTITAPAHGLSNGKMVAIDGTGIPGGLYSRPALSVLAGRPDWELYYVVQAGNDTFKVSTSSGGAPADILTAGTAVKFSPVRTSPNVYLVSKIDSWDTKGSVTSGVYDTTITAPSYGKIKWSTETHSGTTLGIKVRSSSSDEMLGATDWSALNAYTASDTALSIGSGRYIQFMAEISSDPYFKSGQATLTYVEYLSAQAAGDPDVFPSTSGVPYVTAVFAKWVDDVEIEWTAEERICALKGHIGKRNDLGRVKVTIDGQTLFKDLKINLSAKTTVDSKEIEAKGELEVQPLNTGK